MHNPDMYGNTLRISAPDDCIRFSECMVEAEFTGYEENAAGSPRCYRNAIFLDAACLQSKQCAGRLAPSRFRRNSLPSLALQDTMRSSARPNGITLALGAGLDCRGLRRTLDSPVAARRCSFWILAFY
jgi:hypothetical protein